MRPASKKHGNPSSMGDGVVSENRIRPVKIGISNMECRLGLMTLRIALAKLVWTYDFELKEGQGAPSYCHRSLSAGSLELKVKKVERVLA